MEKPVPLQELWEHYFDKAGFGYSVKYAIYEYYADFECYEVMGVEVGDEEKPLYSHVVDGRDEDGPLEGAIPQIEGGVKWDGCINYSLTEVGYIHACGVRDMKKPFEMLEKVYKRCSELIPTFEGDL